MMYCTKHCYFYAGWKCEKCEAGEPPHLRTRDEVADPKEWVLFERRGWTKNG